MPSRLSVATPLGTRASPRMRAPRLRLPSERAIIAHARLDGAPAAVRARLRHLEAQRVERRHGVLVVAHGEPARLGQLGPSLANAMSMFSTVGNRVVAVEVVAVSGVDVVADPVAGVRENQLGLWKPRRELAERPALAGAHWALELAGGALLQQRVVVVSRHEHHPLVAHDLAQLAEKGPGLRRAPVHRRLAQFEGVRRAARLVRPRQPGHQLGAHQMAAQARRSRAARRGACPRSRGLARRRSWQRSAMWLVCEVGEHRSSYAATPVHGRLPICSKGTVLDSSKPAPRPRAPRPSGGSRRSGSSVASRVVTGPYASAGPMRTTPATATTSGSRRVPGGVRLRPSGLSGQIRRRAPVLATSGLSDLVAAVSEREVRSARRTRRSWPPTASTEPGTSARRTAPDQLPCVVTCRRSSAWSASTTGACG